MAQRAALPKFGNWGTEQNMTYTVYFDNVRNRKGKGGAKPPNPNDPEESPDLFGGKASSPPPPTQATQSRPNPRIPHDSSKGHGSGNRVVAQEQQRTKETDNGAVRRFSDFPAQKVNNASGRTSGLNMKPNNGELHKRAVKRGNGPEHGLERPNLHQQGKASGRGYVGSPPREGRSSYDGGRGAPAGSRMRPLYQDGNMDRGGARALPKFGDWNVNNPATGGDGYTQIFNNLREEKHQRVVGVAPPGGIRDSPFNGQRKPTVNSRPTGGCCFL